MKNIPKVKICCISSVEEARTAIHYGASALGLVSSMPSGPGIISEEMIAEIVKTIPSHIQSFLLTSKQDASTIIEQLQKTKTNTIQIVDAVSTDVYLLLREKIPHISIVQVVHVIDENSIEEAKFIEQFVDYLLLDSGNPTLAIKELGGTGRKHNWSFSKKIVEEVSVPVFLAGGLNSENVKEAIDFVRPYGLDLCGGVRTNGKLDEQKLEKFIEAVRSVQ